MKKNKIIFCIVAIVMGVCCGMIVTQKSFPYLRSDWKRFLYIKEALQTSKPDVVVFGNSVIMYGIDTNQLCNSKNGLVWNLATPQQNAIETLVILDALPQNTQNIILGVLPRYFIEPQQPSGNALNSMYMYQYQPRQDIVKFIDQITEGKVTNAFRRTLWQNCLDARWIYPTQIDLQTRRFIRRDDTEVERIRRDLFFPISDIEQVRPQNLEALFTKHYQAIESFELHKDIQKFLKFLEHYQEQRNIKISLLILPEHPYLKKITPALFYQGFDAFLKQQKFRVLDFRDLLSISHFFDHIHPNREGARILTQRLAESF